MGAVVLDTSVVSAAFDREDVHHAEAVSAIRSQRQAGEPIMISAVSVAELRALKGPSRKLRNKWIDQMLDSLGEDAVVAVDRTTAELAGDMRASRPSLKLPDALISACSRRAGAELLTADRRLARLDGARLLGSAG